MFYARLSCVDQNATFTENIHKPRVTISVVIVCGRLGTLSHNALSDNWASARATIYFIREL